MSGHDELIKRLEDTYAELTAKVEDPWFPSGSRHLWPHEMEDVIDAELYLKAANAIKALTTKEPGK